MIFVSNIYIYIYVSYVRRILVVLLPVECWSMCRGLCHLLLTERSVVPGDALFQYGVFVLI